MEDSWKSANIYHKNLLEMQETHKNGRGHDKAKMQVEIQWGTIKYLDKENCLIKELIRDLLLIK